MAAIEDATHNVSSFFKHGRIQRESSKNALKFQFVVTVHRVQLSDPSKIKHQDWEFVVVWTRGVLLVPYFFSARSGAKIAATHYAKCRPTATGLEVVWQREMIILGTVFPEKSGGYQEKGCKFVLKQVLSRLVPLPEPELTEKRRNIWAHECGKDKIESLGLHQLGGQRGFFFFPFS